MVSRAYRRGDVSGTLPKPGPSSNQGSCQRPGRGSVRCGSLGLGSLVHLARHRGPFCLPAGLLVLRGHSEYLFLPAPWAALNGLVHYRLLTNRSVSWRWLLLLSAMERALRRLLTDMGYRYRLQYTRAPGRPDIAFPGRRKLIWVHGCFWHGHPGCPKATRPKSRQAFWVPKLESNRSRDLVVQAEAQRLGWHTLVVWECELGQHERLNYRLSQFLEAGR